MAWWEEDDSQMKEMELVDWFLSGLACEEGSHIVYYIGGSALYTFCLSTQKHTDHDDSV